MNDTIPYTHNLDQSGVAPLNAFVSALAEQVFQRVTAGLAENVRLIVAEEMSKSAALGETNLDEASMGRIKTLVDERVSSYIDGLSLPDEDDVESMVENYLDRNLDVTEAVSEALNDIDLADKLDLSTVIDEAIGNYDMDDKIRDIVKGLEFTVEVS